MRSPADQRNHEAIVAFVAAHPEPCRLTVAELIARTKLPRSTLYRALQDEGGAQAFLFTVRLNAARDLIRAGVPLRELPKRCGFSGAPHLSRRFKARFGLTPTESSKGRSA